MAQTEISTVVISGYAVRTDPLLRAVQAFKQLVDENRLTPNEQHVLRQYCAAGPTERLVIEVMLDDTPLTSR